MAKALSSGNHDRLLETIVDDLEVLKRNQGNSEKRDSNYRYLDDKTLYSSDN